MSTRRVTIRVPHAEAAPQEQGTLAPRLAGLGGRTIGLINNDWLSLDVTYDELRRLLRSRPEVGAIVEKRKLKTSPLPEAELRDLAARADAVVMGLGN